MPGSISLYSCRAVRTSVSRTYRCSSCNEAATTTFISSMGTMGIRAWPLFFVFSLFFLCFFFVFSLFFLCFFFVFSLLFLCFFFAFSLLFFDNIVSGGEDMHKHLAKYIERRKDKIADVYTWVFKVSIPQEKFHINVVGSSWFEKTVSLKDQLRTYLEENPNSHEEVAKYFITEWGGIRRFAKTKEVVDDFSQLKGTKKPSPSFKPRFAAISSWSKWASLVCPDWACIYDTRVAYSINAINYLNGGEHRIFPSPDGRNSRLALLNVSTLLLAMKTNPGESSNPKDVEAAHFIKEKDAYFEYLKLVGLVSEEIWKDRAHMHQVEMLLFALADEQIYKDLFAKVSQAGSLP